MAALLTGVSVPNFGTAWRSVGLDTMARLVEEAGFDDVWLSDHVLLVEGATSPYPYAADRSFFLDPAVEWLDWLASASFLAAATERVRIGVGVCILPLREPLPLAKQIATVDQLSGGRVMLGVGSGWLAEEFAALNVDFASRGARMDASLRLLRTAWTGSPQPGSYGEWELPPGVRCEPTPAQARLPIYVGGDSRPAVRRIAEHGDGWYGAPTGGELPLERIHSVRERIERACETAGRDPAEIELAIRIGVPASRLGTPELAAQIREYAQAGVARITFDLAWKQADEMRGRLAQLAEAVGEAAVSRE